MYYIVQQNKLDLNLIERAQEIRKPEAEKTRKLFDEIILLYYSSLSKKKKLQN